MGRRRLTAAVFIVGGVLLFSAPAAASPVEVFGFGSRYAARAGAGTALADDFAAVYYNPAGLALATGKHVTFGVQGAVSNLSVDERRISLSDSFGFVAGLTAPLPLGGAMTERIHIGLGMYLLPKTIAQVRAHFPDEPFYPWYDNRLQRIVILPGAAVRLTDTVRVGAAVNFLAGVEGGVRASEGSTRALEARVDERIPSVLRLNAGLSWSPTESVRLGLAYRERFEVPFATASQTEVAGEPIDLDLRASGQFTPNQVAGGVAWIGSQVAATADLTWANWSEYPGPFVQVRSELPLVGPLAAQVPAVPYQDTVAIRVALESRGRLAVRGGYGFETSPIPAEQTGVTNLLDGPKHTVGAGLAVRFPDAIGGKELRIDLHLQAQIVAGRTLTKTIWNGDGDYNSFSSLRDEVTDNPTDPATQGAQISNPGYPGLESGGEVYSGGLTMEVAL